MDKIVIQTNSSERGGSLMSCLRTLFPACEVKIQLVEMERHGDVSIKPERDSKDF